MVQYWKFRQDWAIGRVVLATPSSQWPAGQGTTGTQASFCLGDKGEGSPLPCAAPAPTERGRVPEGGLAILPPSPLTSREVRVFAFCFLPALKSVSTVTGLLCEQFFCSNFQPLLGRHQA